MKRLFPILIAGSLFAEPFTLEEAVEATLALHNQTLEEPATPRKSAPYLETTFRLEGPFPDTGIHDVYSRKRGDRAAIRWGESKQFRTGCRVDMTAEVSRSKGRMAPRAVQGGNLNFRITQPLLKGRGEKEIADIASNYAEQAESHRKLHALSETVLNTIHLYWDAAYAKKRWEEKPDYQTEDEWLLAKHALEEAIATTIGDELEELPEVEKIIAEELQEYLALAEEQRYDLLASSMKEAEFYTKVKEAENKGMPKLDAYVDFFRHSSAQNGTYKMGVNFSVPLSRKEIKGNFRRVNADLNRQLLETMKLKESIHEAIHAVFLDFMRDHDGDDLSLKHFHAKKLAELDFLTGVLVKD